MISKQLTKQKGDQVFQAIHSVYSNITNAIDMCHEETKWCKLIGKAALSSMQPFSVLNTMRSVKQNSD